MGEGSDTLGQSPANAPANTPEGAEAEPADLFDYDNPEWYRRFLLHLRYRFRVTDYPILANYATEFLNEETGLVPPDPAPHASAEVVAADVEKLKTLGWCRLGKVMDDASIAAVRAFLADKEMTDDLEVLEEPFGQDAVPASVNIGNFSAADVVAAPHLAAIANRADVLARVAGFLGVPPTIQYHTAWWSFGGRPAPKGAQSFHIDRACYRFLKLFVYLTDVDGETGPHCYVERSFDPAVWRERVADADKNDPEASQRFRRMLTSKRKEDAVVTEFFGADRVVTLTGKAGEAFLVNTAGYHKGVLPVGGDRLLYQALYTMLPTIKHGADRVPSPGFFAAAAPVCGVEESYLRYVNRLVITDGA